MEKKLYNSGAKWESKVGYSRAIRIGHIIEVSGTTSVKDGKVWAVGDPYEQAIRCFEIIEESLSRLEGKFEDVIRTRMYTTDISYWEEIGRAHSHFFHGIYPVTTLVEVSALIDPGMLIEVEATAVVGSL